MAGIALFGATGRMGRAVLPLIAASPDLPLAGALAATGNPALGQDAGTLVGLPALGVLIQSDPDLALAQASVAIDFTRAASSVAHARACVRRGCPIVIGTTGHDPAQVRALAEAAQAVPIVLAHNLSLGVSLMLRLAEMAARALPGSYDIEVFEAHHRDKVDAPSGTALALGEAMATARGGTLAERATFTRLGATGPRPAGAIGFSVLRGGDIVGEHRIVFAGPGERVELAHVAQDRMGFARGAVQAARWLVGGHAPGMYGMHDVLGL